MVTDLHRFLELTTVIRAARLEQEDRTNHAAAFPGEAADRVYVSTTMDNKEAKKYKNTG